MKQWSTAVHALPLSHCDNQSEGNHQKQHGKGERKEEDNKQNEDDILKGSELVKDASRFHAWKQLHNAHVESIPSLLSRVCNNLKRS